MSVLVIGGSQGARILSDQVPAAMAALPEDIRKNLRISHQARPEDQDRVEAFYSDHGIKADVQPFFVDIPTRMSEAQLVISRAGASSLADISVIGRPSILIPLAAAIRDEQTANASGLVDAGAAIALPEAQVTAERLSAEVARILQSPETANSMAQAALSCGRPNAAEDLAALVDRVSKGNEI